MFLIKSSQPKGKAAPIGQPEFKFEPEAVRKESGKVGIAGKGNAKAWNWKAAPLRPGIGHER
ncbi:hypothetical protein ACFCZY_26395, partial [Streptomyces sp. NPDC056237]|uniref:hypothetical protein n=1 Tax=Streptomyces sp. NPDC056237 TaxID=3345758 RepID=UPI0035E01D33